MAVPSLGLKAYSGVATGTLSQQLIQPSGVHRRKLSQTMEESFPGFIMYHNKHRALNSHSLLISPYYVNFVSCLLPIHLLASELYSVSHGQGLLFHPSHLAPLVYPSFPRGDVH